MGKALYRTYRPKGLAEIVGQEHITQALTNALKQGAISHAYLFTGPRGTGKTSIARILAHEINGLPYADDSTHLDIIEIDAASNRRIDEIRDLRDKVHIAPTSAKFKVYIIDEVHMLTREAFNALLKTLEEPPAHVVFILATTEIHKLPETIISRTQRFTFKPVDLTKVAAHLRDIAKGEKIEIDDEALALVAAHGEGSFRDSISLLDQARSVGHRVIADDIRAILGIAPAELIDSLIAGLGNHDASAVVQTLQQLQVQGSEASQIARQLGESLRRGLLEGKMALPHDQLFSLLTRLIDVPAAADPRTFLEIILLDAALADAQLTITTPAPVAKPSLPKPVPAKPLTVAKTMPDLTASTAAVQVEKATHPNKKNPEVPAAEPTVAKTETPAPVVEEEKAKAPKQPVSSANGTVIDEAVWPGVLHKIKKDHNTLYGILRTAEPAFEPGKVTLTFGFAFHLKRCSEATNKKIIADTIADVVGDQIEVIGVLGEQKPNRPSADEDMHAMAVASDAESPSAPPAGHTKGDDADFYIAQAEAEEASRPIAAVSNIFGGGELLES